MEVTYAVMLSRYKVNFTFILNFRLNLKALSVCKVSGCVSVSSHAHWLASSNMTWLIPSLSFTVYTSSSEFSFMPIIQVADASDENCRINH